jgi:integrase
VWDVEVPQLFLRIQPSGVKSWNCQWDRANSRALGKWPGVTCEAARKQARAMLIATEERGAPQTAGRDTVADACRDYVTRLRKKDRTATATDTEGRFERTIYRDPIGKIRLAKLSQDDVEAWFDRIETGKLAALPKKKGRPPNAKPLSKATCNRIRTALVAALNHAVTSRKVPPGRAIEWESVTPHEGTKNRRKLYLDLTQRRALLEAASPDLRDLLTCIALTGCRPGDPAAALRRDYNAREGVVTFRTKDHEREVPLSPAAKELFDRLAKSKLPAAHLFTNGGRPWKHYDWADGVREAATAAGLPADTVAYTLRHCWITDGITGGMDLLTVAKMAGTSLKMIELHYGHLVKDAALEQMAKVAFL